MTTTIKTKFIAGSGFRQISVTLRGSQKLWESHKIKCRCSVWCEDWRSCCWGKGTRQQCSVMPKQTCTVKDPPNLHTPLQTSTLVKKKKQKTLFQKYIYCRNSVLFLPKLKHEFTPIQKIILPRAMPLRTCESCNRSRRVSTCVWVTVMWVHPHA